ncbi:ATP-binding protein [Seleniivibrio woodruffii]|uniref:ATP-binding protein n=1 Tax=Seleniivibrio woodruffii TaxID=1078050 RepID=UPI002409240E|nr:ATP-binding protein [Seleniivibrio woodruffii]
MRVRLFYKIFALALFSVVVSISVMLLTVGYFGYFNFQDYLVKSKIQELTWLTDKLGEYYKENGSFESIRQFDSGSMPFPEPFGMKPFGKGDGGNRRPDMFPGGVADGRIRPLKEKDYEPFGRLKEDMLTADGKLNVMAFVHFRHFIMLQDADKKIVIGVGNVNEFHFISIISDGATVGYLGIRKPPKMTQPMAAEFVREQVEITLVSAVIIIAITGLLTWFFTKRLLAPVPPLIIATRKLASRDFSVEIRDMSNDELGDLAANFRKMAYDLSMYEQKQNRWISDISHELRTPLSVLLGNIEAMQDGVRNINSDSLNILHVEVSRLIKLVNELHEMTMADSDNMRFSFGSVQICRIAEDAVELYRSRAEEFGFQIRTMIHNGDKKVRGDVYRLRQVFINLIENALRHSKSPGVIFISCSEQNGSVLVTVEDTGPGVPEKSLGMLFDRLYRADISRSRETGGSGLGLAICKYIVEKHNGTIRAVCGSMGGLRIEIELPAEGENE